MFPWSNLEEDEVEAGGAERGEDEIAFGDLTHTAIALGIKNCPLHWGSPGRRPARQGVEEPGSGR